MPRTHTEFYDLAMKHKHANTLQKKREIEKAHGIRYTVLLSLPYYDAVRFCLIDPSGGFRICERVVPPSGAQSAPEKNLGDHTHFRCKTPPISSVLASPI